MDIAAGLSAVSSAIGLAKTLRDVDRQLDIAELKAKLADLLENLSDAKIALLESREALREKDAELEKLKISQKKKLQLEAGEGGYLYPVSETGTLTGFPACPKCLEIKGTHTTLVQDGRDVRSTKCPVCDAHFNPVTCYIGAGQTLYGQLIERRRIETERQNAQIAAYNRGTSWMSR